MAPPLVSIAVPIFNTAAFLPAALDSLLAQDHQQWEALLWDDGSSDGCAQIVADYAARDPRFRALGNGRNNGVGVAAASAMAVAAGDYLCVLDSDDELEPDALSSMLAFMRERPQLGMAYSQYREMDQAGVPTRIGKRTDVAYSPQQLLVDFMTYQFRLMRADAYRAIGGFDADMRISPDYDLCLRMSEHYPIAHLPRPLYRYRMRADSISHQGRLRQVRASFDAAQRALQRRGMQHQFSLSLGLRARQVLRPKAADGDA